MKIIIIEIKIKLKMYILLSSFTTGLLIGYYAKEQKYK